MFHGARLHDFGMIAMLAGLGVFASAYGCGSQGSSKAHSGAGTSGGATTAQSAPPAKPAFATLQRNLHPLARQRNDIGPLDPNKRLSKLSVFFKLTPQQRSDRDALLAAQLDLTSPSYHHWLTPQDYAARFGASPDVIARTATWLASQGFEVQGVSPLGARVTFAGNVSTVQNAFQTEIHRYQVGTETHFAMAKAPSIPSELADAVGGLYGTHDFYPHHNISQFHVVTPEAACPTGDAYCSGKGIAPADWANIYDVTPLYTTGIGGTAVTGAGVTIAIVGESQLSQDDINAFRTRYSLPASTVTFTGVPGTGPAAAGNGAGLEAALDVEWSGGIAQGAAVNYVYAGSEDPNEAEAAFYVIEQNLAPIISESFGIAEAAYLQDGYMTTDGDLLEFFGAAASLEGITYIAAAGDSGATTGVGEGIPGLYVSMNASLPGVTGVGGTEFPTGSLSYSGAGTTQTAYSTSEEVWNESDNPSAKYGVAAGGGGISSLFARPSYQPSSSTCPMVGTLPLAGVTASAMRQVPEVSFTAASGNNPVLVECELSTSLGDCTGAGSGGESVIAIGGTSASSPSFAGVVALIEEATGGHRLGNINSMLYAIASSTPSAFHDITTGNNEIECTAGTDPGCGTGSLYGYPAATGYDCASGIGSADVYNLASAWATLTPTATTITPTPSATTLGTPVSLQATVKTSSNANVTSGTVTFGFQSYLANGSPDDSWTLGTAAVSAGTATLSVAIPAGLVNPNAQYVDVVAMYGGDSTYLSSTSTKSRVTFGTISYCISPGTATVPPGDAFSLTATGGTGTTRYFIISDSTATVNATTGAVTNQSTINETTGAFVAGTGYPGYVLIEGYDTSGAESWSWVTVGSPSDDAGVVPWSGDSGILASGCGTLDAGTGSSGGASSSSGASSSGTSSSGTSSSGASSSGTGSSGVSSGGTSGGTSSGSTDDDGGSGNGESSSSGGGHGSGGCSVVATGSEKSNAGLLGAVLGLAALGARRRRRG